MGGDQRVSEVWDESEGVGDEQEGAGDECAGVACGDLGAGSAGDAGEGAGGAREAGGGEAAFLTLEQVARRLQVSVRTVRRMLLDGRLRKADLGGRGTAVRVSLAELKRVAGEAS